MLELSERARLASQQNNLKPNLVLEIEGLETLFGAIVIKEKIKIGDPGLTIGDPEFISSGFYIGGLKNVEDQLTAISFDGSTRSIRQALNIDSGTGSSISTLDLALVDLGQQITRLITPGEILDDVLGRKCKLYLGFDDTEFPRDFVTIFRGEITDIDSQTGKVTFKLNHPDNKKRSEIFKPIEKRLVGSINAVTTTIFLDDVDDLFAPILGPDGLIDPSFKSYVRIDDEIIEFTGFTGLQLNGVVRGSLGSTAASHSNDTTASSFYKLEGTAIELALKIMLSGFNGPYLEDVKITSFNVVSPDLTVPNSIFFEDIDITDRLGPVVGTYVSTSGASNGANNVTLKQITDVVQVENGSYIIVDDVTFVDENPTTALAEFRSQYDVFPDGFKMAEDEVDILEHRRLFELFLSSFNYRFYVREDSIDREWFEEQIYLPIACYSLPRKSRSSLGYHIGPIPGSNLPVLNTTNVKNPQNIVLRRSKAKYFFNEILYKFDEDLLIQDKFLSGVLEISTESKARIKGNAKTQTITARGMRTNLQGASIASSQAERRLTRYRYGAEMVQCEVKYGIGYTIEIGDIVIFDGSQLEIPDITTGQRGMEPRLMEVVQKLVDITTGDVRLDLLDTKFEGAGRYALISPSSLIQSVASNQVFTIMQSFAGKEGPAEYRKWENLTNPVVRIRSLDFTSVEVATIDHFNLNEVHLTAPLTMTPTPGMVMEFAEYNLVTAQQKLAYAWMRDAVTFDDGEPRYQML